MSRAEVNAWFVREVLPLEAALQRYLRHSWRSESDVGDLCQDVFVRAIEAAGKEIPRNPRAFVFAIARNLLINRLHRNQIVSIEAVADLDSFAIAADEPLPDRSAMARQDWRKLQAALARLPERWRDAVVMRKVEGLSRKEIARRMGLAEPTVAQHLASGIAALTDYFNDDREGPRHECQ
ncbi:MAG TPA: RNA polymerase sigma factor [Rhizomicrobium sp.]|nr:RNA polymerase sigma factor [Rhizomicrobium sp.]